MRVGFIGLGNVGAKLAGSLAGAGFDLVVRDLDRSAASAFLDAGAEWGDSPRAMAERCDALITSLPSPAACAAVIEAQDGALEGFGPGKLWLEMSTTDAGEIRRLGAAAAARGAGVLDAPVSGGCHRAATGNIAILAGGERADFERALPLLTQMGRRVVHTGPLGSASVLKVITNFLATTHLVALGEAFAVAAKEGIDMAAAFEAIRVSSGNSFVHETESQVILNGSYDIEFTLDLALKDVGLFNTLGEAHGAPLEISPVIVAALKDGIARYGERAWSSQVVKRMEDDCGVAFRADGFPAQLEDDEPRATGAEVPIRGGRN